MRIATWAAISLFSMLGTIATGQESYDLGGAKRPAPDMSLKRDWQYKRVHQLALRYLLLDRDADARSFLNDYLDEHPDDAETHFLLGLLDVHAGAPQAAIGAFQQAIENGLPDERLVAGPRELLAPVREEPLLQRTFRAHTTVPVHGPLLGHTTASTASIWVRTAHEARVSAIVSRSPDLQDSVTTAGVPALAESDFTARIQINGLQPNTEYSYAVQIDDGPLVRSEHQRFRTFPSPGESSVFQLAFGGGAGFVPPHERMWDTIRARDPLGPCCSSETTFISTIRSRPRCSGTRTTGASHDRNGAPSRPKPRSIRSGTITTSARMIPGAGR